MLEPATPGHSLPRAFLKVAGVTVARHQLGIVLALECQRVICMARSVSPELIALQHDVEATGGQFHVVPGPVAIGGLITANDDVIALADGLLANAPDAAALLEEGPGVLVQPSDAGLPLGFERIDINHAAAGAVRLPGRLVERLNELADDCDAISGLARVALQSGLPMREVPAAAREGARWILVPDEGAAHAIEDDWIRLHLGSARARTPGQFLARFGVLRFGAGLLHGGSGSLIVAVAAAAALLMALGAASLGFTAAALLLIAPGWIGAYAVGMLDRIDRQARNVPAPRFTREPMLGWAFDAGLVVVLALGMHVPGRSDIAFAPLVLVGLLRLLQGALERRWTAWLEDRATIALALSIAAGAGALGITVRLLALTLLAVGLLVTGRRKRLT